jgi:hypothetical protein
MGEDTSTGALPLVRAAELVGAYRWTERRLFELTGAWAADADLPAVQVFFDRVSTEHAWHAELFEARLPRLDGTDRERLTRPAGPTLGPLIDTLAETTPTRSRLAGYVRVVLPRLLVTYDRHLARAVPVADGPVVRALRLVRRDELEAWREGEALAQGSLGTAADADEVAEAQRHLERAVVVASVGEGLVPWPEGSTDG